MNIPEHSFYIGSSFAKHKYGLFSWAYSTKDHSNVSACTAFTKLDAIGAQQKLQIGARSI